MKVVCLQENLHKAVSLISRVSPTQAQLPVLLNTLIKTKKDSLFLWGTDLELGVGIEVMAKIEEEGETTVPVKTLSDLLSILPPEKLEIISDGKKTEIKTKNHRASFIGIPASEFPQIKTKKGKGLIFSDLEEFKKSIKQVVFATAVDETRPVLSGVLFEIENGECTMVATDGYRLSLKKIKLQNNQSLNKKMIIPGKTLRELVFIFDRAGDSGILEFFSSDEENQIELWVSSDVLVSRLLEGEFPDYHKIIPQKTDTRVEVDKEELMRCIKAAAVFARGGTNIINLTIGQDAIVVSANSPQVGETSSRLEAVVKGDDNKIAFNSRFLLEFLSSIDAGEIIFEMTGPLNPGVFRIKDDDSFFHLIMPIRIQE